MSGPATAERALAESLLARPASEAARTVGAHCATRPGVLAILFYGNRLRDPEAGGLLDIYVLTEGDRAWHGTGIAALANRLLPPNVYFLETADGVQAKVAVMSLAAFRHRMRQRAWDTTLWARFTQPATLLYARDEAARDEVRDAVAEAFRTAAWWAARLAPEDAGVEAAWEALFQHTYGAELRVEGGARAAAIVAAEPALYAALHTALIAPARPTARERARARRAWAMRRAAGKLLNLVRLLKAACTFRGGLAYALAKVERHTGRPVELRPWQRRWPRLAAPVVMLRLLCERRLR